MKWKIGDWAVEGYNIVQITEMEKNQVTGISTGFFRTGSNSFNDSLFPLTLENKAAAECADGNMQRLHRERGSQLLNFPDISRKFEDFAHRLCSAGQEDRKPIYEEMSNFYRAVCEKRDELLWVEVDGVKIFGR